MECSILGCKNKRGSSGLCKKCYHKRENKKKRDSGYKQTKEKSLKYKYTKLLRTSRYRDININLTYEEFEFIHRHNKCHYCYGTLPLYSSGLDRKDSIKGYNVENVVTCCTTCNRVKSDIFTYAEFLEISKTEAYKNAMLRIEKLKNSNKK